MKFLFQITWIFMACMANLLILCILVKFSTFINWLGIHSIEELYFIYQIKTFHSKFPLGNYLHTNTFHVQAFTNVHTIHVKYINVRLYKLCKYTVWHWSLENSYLLLTAGPFFIFAKINIQLNLSMQRNSFSTDDIHLFIYA